MLLEFNSTVKNYRYFPNCTGVLYSHCWDESLNQGHLGVADFEVGGNVISDGRLKLEINFQYFFLPKYESRSMLEGSFIV